MRLNPGEIVKIKNGGNAKILEEFGSGGQGIVYKVEYDHKNYALKWYHEGIFKGKEKEFYDNIENNISKGAPTKAFLWPLGITEMQKGSFGYIMEIRPSGYDELTDFFQGTSKKKQVHFASFTAICNAAINIVQGFRELHGKGYSYQDINNGNFFINRNTGDVLICDNDNVAPYGKNLGIMGKQRWMAPEVVLGGNPDKHSDRFSLAVVLFRLLFINHPLEGAYSTPPCMTKALERKYYGEEPVFVYDPVDTRNRPIRGTDKNLALFWNVYPDYIKEAFITSFSKEAMTLQGRNKRILEKTWLNLFFRLRSEIIYCPSCKNETFINMESSKNSCMECKKDVAKPIGLKLWKFIIPIVDGQKIYLWEIDDSREDIETIIAEVIHNPKDVKMLGFLNKSKYTWTVTLPSGETRPLAPGAVVPVREGFGIDFIGSMQTAGKIIL